MSVTNPKPSDPKPSDPRILNYGDHAVLVHWEVDGFDAAVSDTIHGLAARLRAKGAFTEVMPGYDSLVVSFDSDVMPMRSARRRVEDALRRVSTKDAQADGRLIEIAVDYSGPDLAAVAEHAGMSADAVIRAHVARDYRVCMMGFIPGFAFLSEVDTRLAMPRHATPRAHVPAGSVGIANWQTGIYGLDSPGGWQIIGRTDSIMFDASRDVPFLVEAGDRVRFVPA